MGANMLNKYKYQIKENKSGKIFEINKILSINIELEEFIQKEKRMGHSSSAHRDDGRNFQPERQEIIDYKSTADPFSGVITNGTPLGRYLIENESTIYNGTVFQLEVSRGNIHQYTIIKKDRINQEEEKSHLDQSNHNEEFIEDISMTNEYLIRICSELLSGNNPFTGEIFNEKNIMMSQELKTIIQIALNQIEKEEKQKNKTKPIRQGHSWSELEDEQLKSEYINKMSIREICKVHKRSSGAIRARIVRLFPEILYDNKLRR